MNLVGQVRKFCTPARLYLYISIFSMLLIMLQNGGNDAVFCVGQAKCPATNLPAIFIGQALYIAFWTLILQSLCKGGYESISWFMFLFPLIMFFVIIGAGMLTATAGAQKKGNAHQFSDH